MCVCVCVCEGERESVSVCVCLELCVGNQCKMYPHYPRDKVPCTESSRSFCRVGPSKWKYGSAGQCLNYRLGSLFWKERTCLFSLFVIYTKFFTLISDYKKTKKNKKRK